MIAFAYSRSHKIAIMRIMFAAREHSKKRLVVMDPHRLVRLEHCIDVSKCLALRRVAIKSYIHFFTSRLTEKHEYKYRSKKNHMLKVRIKRTRAQKHIDCNWGVIKAVDEHTNATGKSLILTECASFKRNRHRLSKPKCCCMLMRYGHRERSTDTCKMKWKLKRHD